MAITKSPYRGTRDFFPKEMRTRNYIFRKMSHVSELYAYEPYDGPLLEEVDLFRAKSGEELINDQIYSFKDRGDREVAIRPEMTPTVARMVAQVHREIAKPIRWYAIPNLMRYEKPQRGRLREFWQYNADIFGAGEDGGLEILQLAVDIFKSFGASQEHFEILINDRRFVDFVFQGLIGLEPEPTKKLYKLVDAKNKMNPEKFSAEVRAITQDESKATIFEDFVSLKTAAEIKSFVDKFFNNISLFDFQYSGISTPLSITSHVAPLYKILDQIKELGLSEFVKFDPSIVRGLDYYTGLVFEIFDKNPENRRALAGGGAYANLLQIFNESPLEAVGIGIGEVPLTDFLITHNLLPDFSKAELDYLVAYLVPEAQSMAREIVHNLRQKNFKVELYYGEAKPKKIFSYSEKKNFKKICFIGSEEVKNGEVKIKDLENKTESTIKLKDI